MALSDVTFQKILYYCMVPIVVEIVIYLFLRKFGSSIKERLISAVWNRSMIKYNSAVQDIKKIHFNSLHYHKSNDPDLRNRGLLRILEIGAGSGANFEFFPPNSKLTVVEPNAYFEPHLNERLQVSNVKLERFLLAPAEDMKEVADNSIDIVVSTLVLCSVRDVNETLKEVHRVLAPGGKFYFWEHVHDTPGTWLHFVQNLLTCTIWDLLFGCHLNRNIDHLIAADKRFSHIDQKRFNIPLRTKKESLMWKLIQVHVMGVATK